MARTFIVPLTPDEFQDVVECVNEHRTESVGLVEMAAALNVAAASGEHEIELRLEVIDVGSIHRVG